MRDVTQMLQCVSLLCQRELSGVASAQNHHLRRMQLHGLTSRRTLHQNSLDLQADAHVAGLQNLFVVGYLLAIHYMSRKRPNPTHTLKVVEGGSIVHDHEGKLASSLHIARCAKRIPAYEWYASILQS